MEQLNKDIRKENQDKLNTQVKERERCQNIISENKWKKKERERQAELEKEEQIRLATENIRLLDEQEKRRKEEVARRENKI